MMTFVKLIVTKALTKEMPPNGFDFMLGNGNGYLFCGFN